MGNYIKHKMRGKSAGEIAGWVILAIVAGTGLAILFGFVIMWLWNWLMPMIFGLTVLSYWQAVGIFILAKILFGGHGGGSKSHSKSNRSKSCKKKEGNKEFSKWKDYDKYWNEEGEQAYEAYVKRNSEDSDDAIPQPS